MNDSLHRIYKLKVVVLAVLISVAGLALLFLAKLAEGDPRLEWLRHVPVSELGSTLFITGAFVVAYNYIDGRDKELREDERIRRLLRESAPAFRDAVVRGFAVDSEDLKRVATPELLDDIATNVLALRLGDRQFAGEIYTQVRDEAIRAPERWYDVDVSVRLLSMDKRDAAGVPLFSVSVQWEYTVTPSHPVQRFACVSDRDEYRELITDVPATYTWFMTPRPGFDASKREGFELLQFSVDGKPRTIRRSVKKSGQVYSASIGEEAVRAGQPVRIRHLYRVTTPQAGHRLFFELPQPARGLAFEIDYTQTDISHLSVSDLVSTSQRSRISELPTSLEAKVLSVELPGWLLPKAGLTVVWTLASEERLPSGVAGSTPAAPTSRTQ